jgi:hypothetical protein
MRALIQLLLSLFKESNALSLCHKSNCRRPIFSCRCFHWLAAFFHIVRVQFKISLEEMRHICRRLGAGRPPLWRSLAWELQVVRWHLCASTVISDAQTTSAFLNGHRAVPGCSQLPLYMQ